MGGAFRSTQVFAQSEAKGNSSSRQQQSAAVTHKTQERQRPRQTARKPAALVWVDSSARVANATPEPKHPAAREASAREKLFQDGRGGPRTAVFSSRFSTSLPPPAFEAPLEIRASIPPSGAPRLEKRGPKWHPQPQSAAAVVGHTASHSAEKTGLQTSSLFVSWVEGGGFQASRCFLAPI